MKKNTIIFFALLLFSNFCFAQKTYWEVTSGMFNNPNKYKGIVMDLGSGNKLIAYTNSFVKLGNATDFRTIIQSFFQNFDVIKDSIDESKANKLHYFYNPGGKNGLTIISGTPVINNFVVIDGKASILKSGKDTINIYPRVPGSGVTKSSVFSFIVSKIDDLRQFETSNLINDFITKVNDEIDKKSKNLKPAAQGMNFPESGTFPSLFNGNYSVDNGAIQGRLNSGRQPNSNNIAFSVSANIQNYKNYLTPSFNTSIDFYKNGIMKDEYLRFGVYWEPFFLFDKDINGGLKTYRNDFVGLIYEYRRGSNNTNQLGFYAPISIAYLIRRKGDFFEKNTFNFGIGGVKYGAMTIRPFMYFNDFFRNVSPAVQLSVGWAR